MYNPRLIIAPIYLASIENTFLSGILFLGDKVYVLNVIYAINSLSYIYFLACFVYLIVYIRYFS